MRVTRIAVERAFDFAGPEYHELFGRSDATAFQHPLWLDRLYFHLAPVRGAEKLVVTGRTATGQLLFVLPMIRRRKWGITLVEAADLGVSDYAAPVVDRSWQPSDDLVRSVRERLPSFDLLRVRPVRAEAVNRWQAFFPAQAVQQDFGAHAVGLFAPYAEWRKQVLTPSFTKYLDRKKKRLFRSGGAELRLLLKPAEIAAAFSAIQSLRAGRFEGDVIQQNFVRDFYADIAARGVATELARTYALTLDSEPIGYVFGLTHAGRFHYLLIGCDYRAHGRHSPGLLMYDLIMEDWLSSGGDCFDFTIGDEPFKADFGTQQTAIYALSCCATPVGKLALAAFNLRKRLTRPKAAEDHKTS
ncbi:hypothetical protein NTH_02711 [Nitratireductor thuwali]|uniref:BioF2-like acetyltransferase domain-containing protein n=1 Tax=Nitratireductor thuwali TaxID=2267699 RepID=A0ABY5MM54_9HYPH|nr:hypothetical protein NTH_02711 [Nitratireductor thuwali]